jgi:hypothetical protein
MKMQGGQASGWGDACIAVCGLTALVLLAALPARSQSTKAAHHGVDAIASASVPTDPTFYSEMAAVNARMHHAMQVAPSHDVDRDFLQMMIPHHRGAVDMALVLLKYGRDERIKRLAQSIIVEQWQEIAYMRSLLDASGRAESVGRQSDRPRRPSSTCRTRFPRRRRAARTCSRSGAPASRRT